jgi:hypothetical protein
MKLFQHSTDGGKNSGVTAFFIVEIKPLFSIVLLHFRNGTREAYHSHAFNAITWFLSGKVIEHRIYPKQPNTEFNRTYTKSIKPKFTPRENYHKVESLGDTWAISFRGPWKDKWQEYTPDKEFVTLTHGRHIVDGNQNKQE